MNPRAVLDRPPPGGGRSTRPSRFAVTTMTVQSHQPDAEQHATDWQTQIAIRVPRDSGENLASEATRRLEKPTDVIRVEVTEIGGLEPALAATIVQVTVKIASRDVTAKTLREAIDGAPGVQRIERLEPDTERLPKRYGPPP